MSPRDALAQSLEAEHTSSNGDLLAGLRNGAWLDAQVFPPLRWTVPGVIPEGFTLFVGPPKIGKSWFHLSAALGVAAGGAVLGAIRVDPRPVLYLALEDGDRRLQDRCRQLLEGDPIPEAFEYITQLERARPVRGGIPAPPGSIAPAVAVMRAFDEDREQFE